MPMTAPTVGLGHPHLTCEHSFGMATQKYDPTLPLSAKRDDPGSLLKRAINLIDPPRYTADEANAIAADVSCSLSDEREPPCDSQDNLCDISASLVQLSDISVPYNPKKPKKVQFKESSCQQGKKITVHDVMQAYDILIHAVNSLFSDSIKIIERDTSSTSEATSLATSWESLQQYADTYRALLITSCLLLEMLPSQSSNDYERSDDERKRNNTTRPMSCANPPHVPTLSPTITKILHSTSRRCILLLQSLEKLCAMKTISERHTGKSKIFYTGGDDIEDYERSASDLHVNYDWHDDGFLPKPGFYSCKNSNAKNHSTETSLIHECCYRPHYPSEAPSSKYEKSASTKDWIRGDRLISMSLEDYQYHYDISNGNNYPTNFQAETLQGIVNQRTVCGDRNSGFIMPDQCGKKDSTKNNIHEQRQTQNHWSEAEMSRLEDSSFFHISPAVLVQEEVNLLDIMLPCEPPNSIAFATPKRNKKQKKRHHQEPAEHMIHENHHIQNLSSNRKEGFLMLVHDNRNIPVKRRVYAKLHPSGWLSVEDRDIPSAEQSGRGSTLSHRPRYWDYFICQSTVCQPWTPKGVMSFHFFLDDICLLGSSSLDHSSFQAMDTNLRLKLLFAVDEATGGTLSDGFEWVRLFSELISHSMDLHENLCSEYTSAED